MYLDVVNAILIASLFTTWLSVDKIGLKLISLLRLQRVEMLRCPMCTSVYLSIITWLVLVRHVSMLPIVVISTRVVAFVFYAAKGLYPEDK